ncbi:Uncharacterised protein [Enterobacter hormaechei]|uniref:hypothetical protein n=1 Tax=Enterobacter hormaechei TaxID=158836 RepID=UPI000793EC69|nr:hypothetical protein [Enterobacter hormaechei]SAH95456.1 Uncharacterised protein [Enterobacter hormaechei]
MSIKRYEWVACDEHACHCDVVESAEGDMVDYEDYAALEQRLIESERYGRQTDITIDNLEMKLAQMAAENAYLLPKAASELSNAWVLHKYLIGIQAAIMYLDNGNKKAAQEWLYGTIAGPGFDLPDGVDDIDAWATHQMRGSVSHQQALEIIKAETPSTESFIAEVRAQGVEQLAKAWYAIANETDPGISISESSRLKYRQRADDAADFANEIRQEAAQ